MGYAIYCRISRDSTGSADGVNRQQQECQKFADQHGLTVDEVYTDNDVSAFSGDTRPAYQLMMDNLKAGKHEGIICWHVDRLYRRAKDLEGIVDLVEKTGIEVRTLKAGDLDLNNANGRMLARMGAIIANFEVDHQIERMVLSQQSRAVEGRFRGGTVPYGYKAGSTPGGLVIDDEQAAIVREMGRRILNSEPVIGISKDLNRRGVPTQTGKRWRTSTVRRTLMKPSIAGLSAHHGEVVGKAQWEPILDEGDWRAIVAILSDPGRRTQQGNVKRWQGAGVYLCGKCGHTMITKKSRAKYGSGRNYACGKCGGVSRNLDKVDGVVDEVIIAYLSMPENQLKVANREESEGADLGELMDERKGLDERRKRMGSLFASDVIDEDQLVEGTKDLKRKIDRLDEQIAEIRKVSPVVDLMLSGDKLRERWEAMSADIRGEAIDELVTVTILPTSSRPVFDDRSVRITWK